MKKKLITSLLITTFTISLITSTTTKAIAIDSIQNLEDTNNLIIAENEGAEIENSATTSSAATIEINENIIISEPTIEQESLENSDLQTEYTKVLEVLHNFKTTNNTTEADIINSIKDCIDSSIAVSFVSFGTSEEQVFKKIDATIETQGSITGIINISNGNWSKDIQVNLSIDKLIIVKDNAVAKLDAEIEGSNSEKKLIIGQVITVNITGYNAAGEKVKLDESKLKYKWYANGKEVGNDKNLEITQDMVDKFISCNLEYPDEV
ncbi:hypothetical protein GKZ28_08630 [Clostridium chromiireducens]|jgi:hypothetical protein|uniref:Uncharacterized protein n=1 Tax=Clostridium chromiireducens TaxID=225345 RepID=A0A964W1Z2_9CLOT|nr:hypothetical protein [Clostridium chromiireducens]MVX63759.1 hypothetical protein [Clostridium chromiireducens]